MMNTLKDRNNMNEMKFKGNTVKALAGLLLLGLAVLTAPAKDDQPGHDGRQDYLHGHNGKSRPHPKMREVCLQLEGGKVCLYSRCNPGETYRIEATDTLQNPHWEPVCASTVSASGNIEFLDECATNRPARYYRVVWTTTSAPAPCNNNGQDKKD